MPNGNTIIAITAIIAAASFGIVALLVNSETKVNFKGKYKENSVQFKIEQHQISKQKQSDCFLGEEDNHLPCEGK